MSGRRQRPTSVWGLTVMAGPNEVNVPHHFVRNTAGSASYFGRSLTVPPLVCQAFLQTGACPRGEDCNDIHADRVYVINFIATPTPQSWCCAYCGDPFSRAILAQVREMSSLGPLFVENMRFIPIDRMSLTAAVARIAETNRVLHVNRSHLCLHHRQGR